MNKEIHNKLSKVHPSNVYILCLALLDENYTEEKALEIIDNLEVLENE